MPINTQSRGNSQGYSEEGQRDDGSVTHRINDEIRLTEIQRVVENADFPADKEQLAQHAQQQNAPRYVIDLLKQLPSPEFGSENDQARTTYRDLRELMHEIETITRDLVAHTLYASTGENQSWFSPVRWPRLRG